MKSFSLDASWEKIIDKLPDDKAGILLKTILRYMDEDVEVEDPMVAVAFEPIKAKMDKKKEPKEVKPEEGYIYSKFYDTEIGNAADEKYSRFVAYLYGKNMLKQPLKGVLSIRDQLSYDDFKKIMATCQANKVKLGEILTKIENDNKYYKGKTSLYRTLLNWAEGRFVK